MTLRPRSCAARGWRSRTSKCSSEIRLTFADVRPPAEPGCSAARGHLTVNGEEPRRGHVGLKIAVDGSGLERPRAGVGVYTSQILRAMSVDRPDCRLEVFGPRRAWMYVPNATYRLLPRTRFFGRHVQWPAAIRKLRPDAYFGPAGSMPLGNIGCPAAITIHDLAIFRNPKWFPLGQPLSTRLVVPRSVLRADVLGSVSESTARDLVEHFGIDRGRIQVVPHGVSAKFRPMSAEDRAEARARLKLPDRFILFLGTA